MLEVLDPAQAAGQRAPAGRADRPGLDLRPLRRRRRRRKPRRSTRRRTRRSRPRSSTGRAAGDGEGVDRHLHLRAPAQASARGAGGQGRLLDAPSSIDQRDGDWVKVGGMITEPKKIRTRAGTTMMFATLDDLDGAVEIVRLRQGADGRRAGASPPTRSCWSGAASTTARRARSASSSPAWRGSSPPRPRSRRPRRRWRSGRGAAPSRSAAASTPRSCPRRSSTTCCDLFERYPGETEFVLEMHTRTGLRRLKFGHDFRVTVRDAGLSAELDWLLPPVPEASPPRRRPPRCAAAAPIAATGVLHRSRPRGRARGAAIRRSGVCWGGSTVAAGISRTRATAITGSWPPGCAMQAGAVRGGEGTAAAAARDRYARADGRAGATAPTGPRRRSGRWEGATAARRPGRARRRERRCRRQGAPTPATCRERAVRGGEDSERPRPLGGVTISDDVQGRPIHATPRSGRASAGRGPRHLDRVEPLAGAPRALEDHGRPSNRGSDRNGDHALDADLAVAEVRVPVAVGTQLRSSSR